MNQEHAHPVALKPGKVLVEALTNELDAARRELEEAVEWMREDQRQYPIAWEHRFEKSNRAEHFAAGRTILAHHAQCERRKGERRQIKWPIGRVDRRTDSKPRRKLPVADKRTMGLYQKYRVERTDGSSNPEGRHHGCEYFVLDLTHDKFAPPAILAYAEACKDEYPALYADLIAKYPEQQPAVDWQAKYEAVVEDRKASQAECERLREDNRLRLQREQLAYDSRNAAQARCNTAERNLTAANALVEEAEVEAERLREELKRCQSSLTAWRGTGSRAALDAPPAQPAQVQEWPLFATKRKEVAEWRDMVQRRIEALEQKGGA